MIKKLLVIFQFMRSCSDGEELPKDGRIATSVDANVGTRIVDSTI